MASRYAINRLRLAGPRWSVLLFWLYLLAFFLLLGGEVSALLEHMSPAGKMEGERAAAPVEVQAERILRAGGSPA